MSQDHKLEQFFETLIAGDRAGARAVVNEARGCSDGPVDLLMGLFWPAHETLEKLFREDQLDILSYHMATRLLRILVDQNAAQMTFDGSRSKRVFAACGPSEGEELGSQMAVDLLEANGFTVSFAGGGVPADEILAKVNADQPDVLLMFSSAASDLPEIRRIIDTLGEIGACPNLQIAVGGGVFNRAEGLAEEIGADIWAWTPLEMAEVLIDFPDQRAASDQRTVGRNRRKKVA